MEVCRIGTQIWVSIGHVINVILLISTVPIIYKFIKAHVQNEERKTRSTLLLFYPGLIFFIFTFLAFVMILIVMLYYCSEHQSFYPKLIASFIMFYVLQLYMLLLTLWIRLYYVLHGTFQAFSKVTISIMTIIFISILVLSVAGVIIYNIYYQIGYWLVYFTLFLLLILIFSVVTMYIYKLLVIYKNMMSDAKLIEIITKTTMLTIISIFATLLSPIMLVMQKRTNMNQVIDGQMIQNLVFYSDIYTNFLCIVLSYRYFDTYYIKLCKGTHSCCEKMWYKIANRKGGPAPNDITADPVPVISV